VIGAIGGAMFAIAGSSAHPDSYRPQVTFFAYTILIIGGVASRYGPLYGAIIFWFLYSSLGVLVRQAGQEGYLPDWMSGAADAGAITLIAVGIALVLLMVYRPQGLLGSRREMMIDSR
jgi:branched-chain amino acid transport system permease protein